MAESSDVPVVPRPARAHGGFERRLLAISLDQLGGIGERVASVDERAIHNSCLPQPGCSTDDERRQRGVDYVSAIGCWAPMTQNSARSGGCFLAACILGGTVAGIAIGNPMKGVLIGTG